MLSNKLTFSLVLVLMLALVAGPAMAQTYVALEVAEPTTSEPGIENAKGGFFVLPRSATATDSTPADGYDDANGIVYRAATDAPGTTLVDETKGLMLADILPTGVPDLAVLLNSGGTIDVLVKVGGDGKGADTRFITTANAAKQEERDKLKHAVIVSEIMWARNRTQTANAITSQWIEVYVHSTGAIGSDTKDDTGDDNDLAANDVLLRFSARRVDDFLQKITLTEGAATIADLDNDSNTNDAKVDYIVVDSINIVPRFGAAWTLPGQDGNTGSIGRLGEAGSIPPTDLISMYRKADLVEGKYKSDLGGVGLGTEGGSWLASIGQNAYIGGRFVGSPGGVHVTLGALPHRYTKNPASISGAGVIINEVRNDTTEANLDWIELFNNTDPTAADATATNVENWTLSLVSAKDKDTNIASLPKYKLQPGEYLVIYNRHPGETILAGGVNIEDVAAGAQVNKGASHKYVVREGMSIGGGTILLILRNGNDKAGTHEKIVDYVGVGFHERKETNKFDTEVWPFIAWTKPGDVEGFGDHFNSGAGSWGRVTELNAKGVYWPKSRADNRGHKDDWADFGFVGAGYDRDVDPKAAPGTPGYANVAVNVISNDRDTSKSEDDFSFSGMITVSEVMYDARHPRDLVQWIELYNNSQDMAVDLDGWRMEIRNIADGKVQSYVDSGFNFDAHTKILPNQTLLLVSRTGPSSVPRTRVYDLNQRHRVDLGLQRREKVLLSSEGFYIELKAKISEGGTEKMMSVDSAGNLMVDGATRTKQWDLPAADEDEPRRSIVRQYVAGEADPGDMADSWKAFDFLIQSYYGHSDDSGSPGYRRGGPLPVSLSSFRPVRDKATGQVVITWITESELNNAGFNILRSETKTGEFKVINLQGIIAGHGTTSEKHVYTYTDKTAKPNVVYYYQIEDVSLNGNRTTLATTHMRGNVNASGKLTTTWSILKSSD